MAFGIVVSILLSITLPLPLKSREQRQWRLLWPKPGPTGMNSSCLTTGGVPEFENPVIEPAQVAEAGGVRGRHRLDTLWNNGAAMCQNVADSSSLHTGIACWPSMKNTLRGTPHIANTRRRSGFLSTSSIAGNKLLRYHWPSVYISATTYFLIYIGMLRPPGMQKAVYGPPAADAREGT